jgi:hypothetical protein
MKKYNESLVEKVTWIKESNLIGSSPENFKPVNLRIRGSLLDQGQ